MDPATAGTAGFLIRLAFLDRGRDRGAARRGPGPGHARPRRCDHRGRHRSRRPAEPRQPDRRARADLGCARSRSATACGCKPAAWPARSRASSPHSACSTRHSPTASARSWSRTTSCSPRRSCRCATRPGATPVLFARLRPRRAGPSDVQTLLEDAISTPVRGEPTIALEEVDADEVVVRIQATPIFRGRRAQARRRGPRRCGGGGNVSNACSARRRSSTSARGTR